MQSPVQDPLIDRLVLSLLSAALVVTATTTTSATKTPASMPRSVAAILALGNLPAATATLDVKIQGRNFTTDAWTDAVVFAQSTSVGALSQTVNLPIAYKMYQAVVVSAGTSISIPYSLVLAGTDVMNAPIVQS